MELEQIVMPKCREIQQKVDELRLMISANIITPKNIQGCLTGNINDYLNDFQGQVDMLSSRINHEIESLMSKNEQAKISTVNLENFINLLDTRFFETMIPQLPEKVGKNNHIE